MKDKSHGGGNVKLEEDNGRCRLWKKKENRHSLRPDDAFDLYLKIAELEIGARNDSEDLHEELLRLDKPSKWDKPLRNR
ncbi:hypothetical protein PIB30_013139 [Stylosanthes scabra]|uniref:Uncharacterized protein n=1 Tax=Stylosanthes scabra TaxID=79078 RepID=A0ABU6X4G7_9FABA|nr:hypothetical protein [Stylosanthes scabra]